MDLCVKRSLRRDRIAAAAAFGVDGNCQVQHRKAQQKPGQRQRRTLGHHSGPPETTQHSQQQPYRHEVVGKVDRREHDSQYEGQQRRPASRLGRANSRAGSSVAPTQGQRQTDQRQEPGRGCARQVAGHCVGLPHLSLQPAVRGLAAVHAWVDKQVADELVPVASAGESQGQQRDRCHATQGH